MRNEDCQKRLDLFMSNYTVTNRNNNLSAAGDENANDIFNRLKKIQGLAGALAQIAAGEKINPEFLNANLFEEEDCQNLGLEERVRKFEIELISDALIQTGGRQNGAAKLLGIKLTTLNAKIKRYKIPVGQAAVYQIKNFKAGAK
jgi:DNA-binding NtrC family response regulator